MWDNASKCKTGPVVLFQLLPPKCTSKVCLVEYPRQKGDWEMNTCERCAHFRERGQREVIDSYQGSRNFTREEVTQGKHCHRGQDPFVILPSAVCSLYESPLEHRWFFWVKWIFPWFFLYRSRKLAKKQLEIESVLRDNGHALRAALVCAFSGLKDLFNFYRAIPQNTIGPAERILYNTLDNLGAVADQPMLADIIQDLGVKNPEEGTFYV